ncbi:hypothetical protein [Rathayibacter agropyri]|uniref:hypothetical protein n=1 Tax=Rathayibacter agropyri TaxID=1634927 RepID=UPI001566309B|nr:hypothetical protein [Rathayibacter agropyri]NRD08677.1 hypothetical protein [Rathayibacter agropyri]
MLGALVGRVAAVVPAGRSAAVDPARAFVNVVAAYEVAFIAENEGVLAAEKKETDERIAFAPTVMSEHGGRRRDPPSLRAGEQGRVLAMFSRPVLTI